jgi:hypothetical protein
MKFQSKPALPLRKLWVAPSRQAKVPPLQSYAEWGATARAVRYEIAKDASVPSFRWFTSLGTIDRQETCDLGSARESHLVPFPHIGCRLAVNAIFLRGYANRPPRRGDWRYVILKSVFSKLPAVFGVVSLMEKFGYTLGSAGSWGLLAGNRWGDPVKIHIPMRGLHRSWHRLNLQMAKG